MPSLLLTSVLDCGCGSYFSFGKTKSEEQTSLLILEVLLKNDSNSPNINFMTFEKRDFFKHSRCNRENDEYQI